MSNTLLEQAENLNFGRLNELKERAEKLFLKDSSEVNIENDEQYQQHSDYLKKVKALAKETDQERKTCLEPIDKMRKAVHEPFKEIVDNLTSTRKILEQQIGAYLQAKERERRRLEMEQKKRQREALQKYNEEIERQAKEYEEQGHKELAEEVRQDKKDDDSDLQQREVENTPEVSGQHVQKKWKGKVTDMKKVPKEILLKICDVNQSKLDSLARYYEGKQKIKGIEFYQDTTIVNR